MLIRVDTYENLLDSVDVMLATSPYTLIETIAAEDITSIAGGAYEVTITDTASKLMLILKDVNGESLGIRYCSTDYLFAFGDPPWQDIDTGSETVILTIRDTSNKAIAGAAVYITTDEGGLTVIRDNLVSNSNGKVFVRLNPGTFYIWASATNATFNNPTEITVTDE